MPGNGPVISNHKISTNLYLRPFNSQWNAPGTVFVTMIAIPIDDFEEDKIFLNNDRSDKFKKYLADQLPSGEFYNKHVHTRCKDFSKERVEKIHKTQQQAKSRRKRRKDDGDAAALEKLDAEWEKLNKKKREGNEEEEEV